MKIRAKIILPLILLFVGFFSVVLGRSGQVNADLTSQSVNLAVYAFLLTFGFVLIAISAIAALFFIAESEEI